MAGPRRCGRRPALETCDTLLDSFVAISWGVFAFREHAAHGTVYLVLAAVGGLAMVVGAISLSRSPVLQHGEKPSSGGSNASDRSGSSGGENSPAPENALSR